MDYRGTRKKVYLEQSKIAVVDSGRIKEEAKCFKAHEKLADMLSGVIARMRCSEDDVKKKYETVKNDKSMNKKQKEKTIEKITSEWQTLVLQYKDEVQKIKEMDIKLSAKLQKVLLKVIENISKYLKIDIVQNSHLSGSILVFYHSKNVDITDIAIKEMDKIMPVVNLKELE
ncbi:MAG: OmpH family outer membrane protein [Puniceicoccales bacterium]|jgi:hypothetical protein|nr:OmpH family outer membrane protein [Puniceicoccales bacterium]